jgi:putative redox protein
MSVTARSLQGYQVAVQAGQHQFVADEPAGVGDDAGPTPYDLLLSALGACTVMTIQMYARRKGIPLEGVEINLDTYSTHANDCQKCEEGESRVSVIERRLSFKGNLSIEQIQRLTEIANRCPVHRTLSGDIRIHTSVV